MSQIEKTCVRANIQGYNYGFGPNITGVISQALQRVSKTLYISIHGKWVKDLFKKFLLIKMG